MRCAFSWKGENIKGVIFDIDGTIIDSISEYREYFNEGLSAIGVDPVSREMFHGYLSEGVSLRDMLRLVAPPETAEDKIEMVYKKIIGDFVKIDMEIKLLPGVRELFTYLKDTGRKIGLATGRVTDFNYEIRRIRRLKLEPFIQALVTSVDVPNRKPAPDIIIETARRLGLQPSECLAVGDTVSDIRAAHSAGAMPIAVTTGVDNPARLKEASPVLIVDRIDKIIEIL